jgi:hypothetical protein
VGIKLHILRIKNITLFIKLVVGLLQSMNLLVAMANLSLIFTDAFFKLSVDFNQLIDLLEGLLVSSLESIVRDIRQS